MQARERLVKALGWTLVALSFPVWGAAFLVPWLPVDNAQRAAAAGALIALGELMFWVGGSMVGAHLLRRLRPPKVDTGVSMRGKRVAVVGAGGGLGGAVAHALHREGATVVVVGRPSPALQQCATELGVVPVPMDLAQPAEVAEGALQLAGVDHVVVAAGRDTRKPLASTTAAEMSADLSVNLRGPMHLTSALLPLLNPQGSILFLGGFADGRLAFPFHAVDVATRAGLAAFCEAVNREQRALGHSTRVQWLCPAPADTAAERPYAPLWQKMGVAPVAPSVVANAVLTALLTGAPRSIMGGTTRLGALLNAISPALADVLFLGTMSRTLAAHFGSSPAPQPAPPASDTRSALGL